MKKLLVASSNEHKFFEIKKMLENIEVELLSLKDLECFDDVAEDGKTFAENALIKARYYYEKFKIPTIADDSGIIIDYFNNFPGIYSARFLKNLKNNERNEMIVNILKDVSNKNASFTASIAYVGKIEKVFVGKMLGKISDKVEGELGFGYDPIFIPDGYDKTISQLGDDIKNKISHRSKAINEFINFYIGDDND